jgi:hypothetical protein
MENPIQEYVVLLGVPIEGGKIALKEVRISSVSGDSASQIALAQYPGSQWFGWVLASSYLGTCKEDGGN